ELQPQALAEAEVLEQARVEVVDARPAHDIDRRGANAPALRHPAEGGGVEVTIQALAPALVRVADEVGPLCARAAAEFGHIARLRHGEGRAALKGRDARHLPAAEDLLRRTASPFEERKLIDVVESKHVGTVQ